MLIPKKILADTSFLIALVNKEDVHHQSAIEHFKFLRRNNAIFYLSPIVESELMEDLSDTELPLISSLRKLSFTTRDGSLAAKLRKAKIKKDGGNRDGAKDDIKILAQAITNNLDSIITADGDGIRKFFESLCPSKNGISYICVTKDCKDNFEIPPELFTE